MDIDVLSLSDLAKEPHRIIEQTTTRKWSYDLADLADFHLASLQKRFRELVEKIPVVRRFAEEQGLKDIEKLEDGALMLLPHTIYKSYSLSVLENSRFGMLTKWLNTLTSYDLSGIDASGAECIDDWIDILDANTSIRLRHSSGTTGKLSFIPTSLEEARTSVMGIARYFEGFGDEPDAHVEGIGTYPFISFAHRKGAMGSARTADAIVEYLYGGDESKLVAMNPGRMSADMLSLGGRLEGARQRGEHGQLQLSPALLRRREQFVREQAEIPRRMTEFFAKLEALRGQRVVLSGIIPPVFDAASRGLLEGHENLFSPRSPFFLVGGSKGRTFPSDFKDQIVRFTGVPYPPTGYGMTEAASGITRMCPKGRYHIPPNIIPYLLDPESGAVLPRTGVQTGRYGIIDVGTQSRWGGFLTSDEITLNFGDKSECGCGRKGPFIAGDIRRYSESEGGDDKITCAGAPEVHDKALEFIAGASE